MQAKMMLALLLGGAVEDPLVVDPLAVIHLLLKLEGDRVQLAPLLGRHALRSERHVHGTVKAR